MENLSLNGGCGNPGGLGQWRTGYYPSRNGLNGTGGLLIIYACVMDNSNGAITANGVGVNDPNGGYNKSGSSGGGSINVFYKESMANGKLEANGGKNAGIQGGTGSITIGDFKEGNFVCQYKNY